MGTIPTPQSLKQMVEYQEGSVVSRTLIDSPAGTVTVFAFARGQGLSEHVSPYDAMVYILEGEALIFIDGEPISAKEGQQIIMPASHPHSLRADQPFKMLLILVRTPPVKSKS